MSQAATEQRLSTLHGLQAEGYILMLQRNALPVDDPNHLVLTASDRQAINAFLKNNDITCTRDEGSAVERLDKELAARQAARDARRAPKGPLLTDRELDDAIDDAVIQ